MPTWNLECPYASDESKHCILLNADCKTVLPFVVSKSVNVVIIDPPYGAQTHNNATKLWDDAWKLFEWEIIVANVFRILKPGGHFVVFSGGKTLFDIHANVMAAYKHAFDEEPSFTHMIWKHDANDSGTVHSHLPRSQFENMMVYWRTGEARIMEKYGCLTQTDRFFHHTGRSNVIHAYKDDCRSKPEKVVQDWFRKMDARSNGKVSTFDMKPEQLLQFLIRDYSNVDGTVLDFCMNRGITGVAALNLKRRFIGVELDPTSYGLAKERIAEKFRLNMTSESNSQTNIPESDEERVVEQEQSVIEERVETIEKRGEKRMVEKADKSPNKKARRQVESNNLYDTLKILGKNVEVGTPKAVVDLYIKSVEPAFEPQGGRYTVVYPDGKEATITILKKMVQSVA